MSGAKSEETYSILNSRRFQVPVEDTRNVGYGSIAIGSSHPHQIKIYKRRWWIVLVFSLCSVAQSAQWNTWSPISDAVEIVYNWDASIVTTFPAVSNAGFIVFGFCLMYAIETKGKYVQYFTSIT